ncbi:MAG: antibiotic biosynthesis monooxygenase [Bacteroidales bacterium]|nr:antibiotic biosynthesis monooxygenase [Bacteroidales bacterium]
MKKIVFILSVFIIIASIACNTQPKAPAGKSEKVVQTSDFQKMILARVFVKPDKEVDFINAAKLMIENSNKEEGCLSYMLYQDPYEKTNFIFVETYRNQSAIDAHFATSYFKEFGTIIEEMISKPTEIKIYDIKETN